MAVDEPRQDPPPRLATNEYLVGHELRDLGSRYMAKVVWTCDRGVIVVVGAHRYKPNQYAEHAEVWDNWEINEALIKTYGRKVRRA